MLLGVGHGFVSSGLFTCVGGVLYDRSGTRSISLYKGLTQLMPLFVILFFILCLGNCGAPLTLNFVGEFLSLFGVFERLPYLGLLAGISIVFSAAYTIYLFNRTAFGGVFSKFFAENISDISLRETNILLLLVLFTVILGIYPSIITDGLNYTLSTLIYEVGASSLDNHDVYFSLLPAAPSLLPSRDIITPINQLTMKFKNNPEIVPSILDYSIKVAEGTISVMSTTVILGGVSVPVCGIAAVVLFASCLYAFSTGNQLHNIIHGMNNSREQLIELGTEGHMMGDVRYLIVDDPRILAESNSSITEEMTQWLYRKRNILETTPDDSFIIGKSNELHKILETLHEYFARALNQFNPIDVEDINYYWPDSGVRDKILSFFYDVDFAVSHMTEYTDIPELGLQIS